MQKLVDEVNTAADDTGEFGRVSDHLIKSAQNGDYPLHYAWEREGEFEQQFRADQCWDADMTANFAVIAQADNYTFSELEDLWKSVVQNVTDADVQNADFFDAQFGSKRVRIVIYQMHLDTNIQL